MDSTLPLFSVIVPTYNQANFLSTALESLLAQTHPNWEALIVNDGSTDGTAEVAESYAGRDSRFHVFHQANAGVAAALNKGLHYARGEWICWLSSDDFFVPEKLQTHLLAIQQNPKAKFFHTAFYCLNEGSNDLTGIDYRNSSLQLPEQNLQILSHLRKNFINGITIAVHRSVFSTVGRFYEGFRYGQDFDMWLRVMAKYPAHFIPALTAVTRLHSGQTTNSMPDAGKFESAVAAVIFLNANPLPGLFPLLDLGSPEHIRTVFAQVISAALDHDAYMNRCGLMLPLLDRAREFISSRPDAVQVAEVQAVLGEAIRALSGRPAFADLSLALTEWHACLDRQFSYREHSWADLLCRHVQRLSSTGQADRAHQLSSFFESFRKAAPHLESSRGGQLPPDRGSLGSRIEMPRETPKITFFAGDGDNFHFAKPIMSYLAASGYQVQTYPTQGRSAQEMFEVLKQSSLAWFEWGNGPIEIASQMPRTCPIICRIHRYEAYGQPVKNIQWQNVDDLIFVNDVFANVFQEAVGQDVGRRTRIRVIPNPIADAIPFKVRRNNFKLAFISRFQSEKNPALMVQVLSALVKRDPRYTLAMIGSIQDYQLYQYCMKLIKDLGLEGHFSYNGLTDDVTGWLDDKSFLISTSIVESQGLAIMEAMMMGIKPIIHASFGDLQRVYDPRYIFQTVEQAVAMITGEEYHSDQYRSCIVDRYAGSVVLPRIKQLIDTHLTTI